jgi:hypothetical protein
MEVSGLGHSVFWMPLCGIVQTLQLKSLANHTIDQLQQIFFVLTEHDASGTARVRSNGDAAGSVNGTPRKCAGRPHGPSGSIADHSKNRPQVVKKPFM